MQNGILNPPPAPLSFSLPLPSFSPHPPSVLLSSSCAPPEPPPRRRPAAATAVLLQPPPSLSLSSFLSFSFPLPAEPLLPSPPCCRATTETPPRPPQLRRDSPSPSSLFLFPSPSLLLSLGSKPRWPPPFSTRVHHHPPSSGHHLLLPYRTAEEPLQ